LENVTRFREKSTKTRIETTLVSVAKMFSESFREKSTKTRIETFASDTNTLIFESFREKSTKTRIETNMHTGLFWIASRF